MKLNQLNAEFDRLLAENRFEEAEQLLREHTEVTPPDERPAPFSAPVRLKGSVVSELEEAAIALPIVNTLSRKLRNARYRVRIASGYDGIRIVEEGDSWHQYPVILDDIIDVVSEDFAVYSLAAAGDTIEAMALSGEYADAIQRERPHLFMISAGGNDLLGEGRLSSVLKVFTAGANPKDLIKESALKAMMAFVIGHFRDIVERALSLDPDLKICFHGYDYAIPVDGGRWLGQPFADKAIPLDVGRDVIKILVDRFNAELAKIAADHPGAVFHVNLRKTVGDDAGNWRDELHPENPGFRKVARKIIAKFPGTSANPLKPETLIDARIVAEAIDVTVRDRLAPSMHTNTRRARSETRQDRLRRMLRDPEIQQAWADVDKLLATINEPESADRIAAREDYSLYSNRNFFEQIINENNMDEYFVLSRGTLTGKAVARLFVRSPGAGGAYATGFLVGPNLLLTNNHVIPDGSHALNTLASFDYEFNTNGDLREPRNFRVTGEVFLTSERLDYTFVSVEPVSRDGASLTDYGQIALLPRSGKALKKEYVNIIQHPGGDLKKVALRENQVIGPEGDFLYYITDTMPGSSGSPVLNEEWQIASLHHMAVPDKNDPSKFSANRGVRVSAILADVNDRRNAGDAHAAEVDRRLQLGRQAASNGGSGGESAAAASPSSNGDASTDHAGEMPQASTLGESLEAFTPEEARGVLSEEGYDLIVDFETGGRNYYDTVIRQKPIWPGGQSGVTIGIGYDLGYHSLAEFRRDWRDHLGTSVLQRLEASIGKTGNAARVMIPGLGDIRVSWEAAIAVFDAGTLTKYVSITYANLPRSALDMLHSHCVSALVSLVFNRGASFRKPGDRYREMREILRLMNNRDFGAIPAQFRSMKRIWAGQGLDGLLRRRDAEAALFENGLAASGDDELLVVPQQEPGAAADVSAAEDAFAENLDKEGDIVSPTSAHFEATMPHIGIGAAKWPSDPANAPDTWHLPIDHVDDEFELTAGLVRALIAVGQFNPHTATNGKLILSLRGCQFADGGASKEDKASIRLRPVNPDHEDFRCLIGVLDTANDQLSLYLGSTVPRRTGMLKYYNKVNFGTGTNCNMLPTGCYEHCVGTHGGSGGAVTFVLRLGDGPTSADAGRATVLRTSNDLTYGTMDLWDDTVPADNIHPAFLSTSFSSLGCLTVHGKQTQGGSHTTGTGEWRMFRKKAGFDGANHAKRFDNLLVTGHEAAAVAAAQAAGGDLSGLTCLRHGSKGARVDRLQSQLGLDPDGDFGAGTRKSLAALQLGRLGFATGTWTPKMAELLGLQFDP